MEDVQSVKHHGKHDNGRCRLEAVQGLLRKYVGGRFWRPWPFHLDASNGQRLAPRPGDGRLFDILLVARGVDAMCSKHDAKGQEEEEWI